ncbi:zinc finger CCCH domain-containing protein 65-like isoform X23 [Carya illinoinensis]|uniref:zinc finger CCCH domain-containing protein 65-like isoform X23 n=1 Tax=Carya illinoinensis TaxID=32201 RepID=UPI001C71C1DE|nr:zinc finger CCCH domain-containing protein 65-like isoform X23 [Carya illinoinensis]
MGQSVSNLASASSNTSRESGFQSPPIRNPELDRAPSNPDRPADERTLVIEENLPHLDLKEVLEPVLKQEDLKEADEVLEGEKENGPSNWEEGMGGGSEWNGWGDNTNPQVPWIVTDDNGNENETVIEDRGWRNGGAFTESHHNRSFKTRANRFGSNCKYNRPVRRKNKAVMEKVKGKEESMAVPGQTECKAVKVKQKVESMAMPGQTECKVVKEKVKEPGKSTERPGQTECKVVKEKVKEPGKSTERPGQTECKVVKEKVKEPGKSTERPGQTECKVVKEKVKEPGKSTERPGQTECKVVKEKVKEPGKSTERPGQTECKSYLTSGVCKYGRACRYKHTRSKASGTTVLEPNSLDLPMRPVVEEKVKELGESTERSGQTECKSYFTSGVCKYGRACRYKHTRSKASGTEVLEPNSPDLPMRPTIVIGWFNLIDLKVVEEKVKERGKSTERPGQTECKSYLTSGVCKYGRACKHKHTKGKASGTAVLELNFLDLPIRPGAKECPYYMSTGSCKYGTNCRFNHPDPLAVDQEDDGGSAASGASQSSMQSSSPPRTLNVTAPYVPMELSPSPGFPPQNPHGYQAPVYIPEMSMHPTLAEANVYTYYEDPTLAEANVYTYYEDQVQVDEYPERPGQPECSRFIKTGDCKFKLNCRYHHPKDRIVKSPPCALSDTGLPLRPDHNICEQYSRYGICKFGQACKFDHPVHPVSGWEW